jgi:ubiquinone/menaquinone biosynthesis C-methylase UbiE
VEEGLLGSGARTRARMRTRAHYDLLSPFYPWISGYPERHLRAFALELLAPRPGEWIAEVGFGAGHSLTELASAVGEGGLVLGVDLSPNMVVQAQARLRRAGLSRRAWLKEGDATGLSMATGSCDGCLLSFILELFEIHEIDAVLSECSRILKRDGRLVVVSLDATGPATLSRRVYEWGHRRLPGLLDCRPIPVLSALEEAGFLVDRERRLSLWGLPVTLARAHVGEPAL